MSRQDLISASKVIVTEDSKTKALFIPARRSSLDPDIQTADYDVDNDHFISFCNKFTYLGTTITGDLDDTTEIKRR